MHSRLRCIPLTAATLLLVPAGASAVTMTFTQAGWGKGTLAGVSFPLSQFTFTATANTANRRAVSYGWQITNTSASVQIAGLGSFDLLSGTGTFVGTTNGVVGFGRCPVGLNLFYGPISPALVGWDMLTPIGPITATGYFSSWQSSGGALVNTTGGILMFDDGSSTMTFTATPEPATLSLLALGSWALVGGKRREKGFAPSNLRKEEANGMKR